MTPKKKSTKPAPGLQREIEELRVRLAEAEETLRAIREGEVDAVIVSGSKGEQVFSLVGTDSIYRVIVETMKEAAFTVTFDGKILFCNAQFGEFVKRPLETVVGRPLQAFVTENNRAAASSLLVAAQQQPVKQRLVFQATDGTAVPAHISANVLNLPDGLSICVVANDLTELENSTELIQQLRRQQEALQAANEELAATEEELRVQNEELAASRAELDRTRARYQDLFETAPDGYLVTDPEGTIQEVNQAAAHLLGRSAAELRGNPFSCLLPAEGREGFLKLMAVMNRGTTTPKWEVELRPLKGPQFWAAITAAASCDENGKIVGLRWLMRDVTARKQAEDALRESEERFRLAAAATHAMVYDLDVRAKRVNAMQGLAGLLGYDLAEAELSLEWWDRQIHPDDLEACHAAFQNIHADSRDHTIEYRLRHKDGRILCVEDHATPVRDGAGQVVRIVGTVVDITERKRAEESLRKSVARFGSVLDNSQDVIYRVNLQTGRFEYISPSAEMVTGYTSDELTALSLETALAMIHPDDMPGMQAALAVLEATGQAEVEYRQRARSGDYRWLSNRMSLIRDDADQPLYRDGNIREIGERKRAEIALRKAAEELARSNKDLESFAHVASHDLQEPLRMVNGFLDLLQDRYKGQLDAKAQEYIGLAVDGATRMSALIRDLLEYARVGSKDKQTVAVKLDAVVDYAKANLRATIEESNAVIIADSLPTVMADEGQMRQLFQNLMGNALKFRQPGVRPEVFISARVAHTDEVSGFRVQCSGSLKQDGEKLSSGAEPINLTSEISFWLFSIRDNGIGIDPTQVGRLFQVFQRLHNREEYPGTGIGLAICKKIVERHGGRIWIESTPGKGSTFRFTLWEDRAT